ncbi:MAG TPA: hypothetical protein VHE79_02595 [Spirochaetia bacterium]
MSIIYSILEDELSRLDALRKLYEKERSRLPRGSLCVKRRANNTYLYLAHREEGRVVQRYVCRGNDSKAQEIRQLVERRMRYDIDIKAIDGDMRRIRKMLNVR